MVWLIRSKQGAESGFSFIYSFSFIYFLEIKKKLLLSLFLMLLLVHLWWGCPDLLCWSSPAPSAWMETIWHVQASAETLDWVPLAALGPSQRWYGLSVSTFSCFWRSCFHLSSLPHRSDWPRAAVVLDDLDNLVFLPLKGNPELVPGPLPGPWPADSSPALGVLLLPIFIHPAVSRSSDQRLFLKNNINRGFLCKTESQIFKLLLSRLFHMTFGVCVSEHLERHFFEFLWTRSGQAWGERR